MLPMLLLVRSLEESRLYILRPTSTSETVPNDRSMPLSPIGDCKRANGGKMGAYVHQMAHISLMGAEDEWDHHPVLQRRWL